MITNTNEYFIEIIAEEGKELFDGEHVTNRVTAPLGTDLSNWIERDPVPVENSPENTPPGAMPGI